MNTKVVAIAVVAVLIASGVGAYALLKENDEGGRITIDVDLEIFGNADKNDVVDEEDAKLVESYISAKNSGDADKIKEIESKMSKDFADANHDGTIDSKDVEQIRAINAGTEENLWLLDGFGNVRKISTDISRIGCEYFANTELCLLLGLSDKIYAVDFAPYVYRSFYFSESQANTVKDMGNMSTPNYDELNKLDLDILLTFYTSAYDAKQEKIYGCDTIFLGLYNPDITNVQKSSFVQGVLKAGYIFNVLENAQKYIDWILNYRDILLDHANSIQESDKPTVLAATWYSNYFNFNGTDTTVGVYSNADPLGQAITLAGGHNVYKDLDISKAISSSTYSAKVTVDTVLGTNTDVDCIVLHMVKYTYGGSTQATTPSHGYLVNDDTELKNGVSNVRSKLSLVEDDMALALAAGEFRNGCTAGVLLGAYLGCLINPDVYSDIDPVKMMNEYVAMMGIEGYDAAEDGEFFYTSPAKS